MINQDLRMHSIQIHAGSVLQLSFLLYVLLFLPSTNFRCTPSNEISHFWLSVVSIAKPRSIFLFDMVLPHAQPRTEEPGKRLVTRPC
uniref:Uncharacterized protein n=1 Tax=Anopheles atroparvus TaxID=41427 RepID=A0AAG5DI67_ANOAO